MIDSGDERAALDSGGDGGDDGPLPGTVFEQFIQCGKPKCRCRQGELHGPYFYRVWRGEGRAVHKVYVRKADAQRVQAQCAQYRALGEALRALRALRLAYTRRLRVQMGRSARLRAGRRA